MKQLREPPKRSKLANTVLIISLYTGSALITGSGVLFAVYSVLQDIRLSILSLSIPGSVIAMLMLFFGIRSFFSVRKLNRVLSSDLAFVSIGKSSRAH